MNQMNIVRVVSSNDNIMQFLSSVVRVVIVPVNVRELESAAECAWCGSYGPGTEELLPEGIIKLIDSKPKLPGIDTPKNITYSSRIFIVSPLSLPGKDKPAAITYYEVKQEDL